MTRTLVFANAPFDVDVIEKHTGNSLKEQVEHGNRLFDVNIMYRLWKLATVGDVPRRYSLAHISNELLGIDLDKNEDIRCNFAEYKDTLYKRYPNRFLSMERQTYSQPSIALLDSDWKSLD